jgi:hypothetical protein
MGNTEMVPEKTKQIYDRDSLVDFAKQQLIQVLLIAVLHWKFELVQPLILSSVLALAAFPEAAVLQAHLLGKDLDRPFPYKAPGGLMGLLGGDSAAPEKKKD